MSKESTTDYRNPWFWGYIAAMFILVTIVNVLKDNKGYVSIALYGIAIVQLVYNLILKEDSSLFKYLQWIYFSLFLLSAVIYTFFITGNLLTAVILILIVIGSGFLGVAILHIHNLLESKSILGLLLSYFFVTISLISFFGFAYLTASGFENHKIVDTAGNSISNSLDYIYFSSSVYYASIVGYYPMGISKLITQIQLMFSFVLHVILIGLVIPKTKDWKWF